MTARSDQFGPWRATLTITLRAFWRATIIWFTATQFHLLDLKFFALFLIFFSLGFGNFVFLSTRPVSSERTLQFKTLFRRYQDYMLHHPHQRPKGDALQWIGLGSSALASGIFSAWLVMLVTSFIFALLGEQADFRVGFGWAIISALEWLTRLMRLIGQGQVAIFGVPFDEAYERVAQVSRMTIAEDN